jgi:hypothetical protein
MTLCLFRKLYGDYYYFEKGRTDSGNVILYLYSRKREFFLDVYKEICIFAGIIGKLK